jgi:hypothetical protein
MPSLHEIPATIAPRATAWRGFPAWALTDGRLEALVVPALGRVMSFRRRGGEELLWQMPAAEIARHPRPRTGWRNWGGDRTWLAPQGDWRALAGRAWPPDATWGEAESPHEATILPGDILRVTGPVSPASGVRLVREHGFADGEFVVAQRAEKLHGTPVRCAPWAVTCAPVPAETVIATGPASAYPNAYYTWPGADPAPAVVRRGDCLHIAPAAGRGYKIGVDGPHAAIAARGAAETLVLRATRPPGDYPDGVGGAPGFPVELYTNGPAGDDATEAPMVELELLAPLVMLAPGETHTLTTRWSVLAQPSDAEIHAALTAPVPPDPPLSLP